MAETPVGYVERKAIRSEEGY